jgi:ABC-type Mn2+/Zn2+ transport system ATPase subunit
MLTLLDDVPIRLTNVTVGWNVSRPIVSNINLQIKKNSLTAIIGPVGSGKSTVMSKRFRGLVSKRFSDGAAHFLAALLALLVQKCIY